MSLRRHTFLRLREQMHGTPCPSCSFCKDDHKEMLEDALKIPAFRIGKHSGLLLLQSGCEHALRLVMDAEYQCRRFRTPEEAAQAWARWCAAFYEPGQTKIEREPGGAV